MEINRNHLMIAGGVIIALWVVYYWWYKTSASEAFGPAESKRQLDEYYNGSDKGIENYRVDTMVCSKKCCGDQWPVPFDGLTSAEIEQTISTMREPGPFVRTNYTCANGVNGVGCPCINKKAYKFLVNHGHNAQTINDIEPTFLIRGDVGETHGPVQGIQASDMLSPYEVLQSERSVFVASPKMNDLALQRSPNPVTHVSGVSDSM